MSSKLLKGALVVFGAVLVSTLGIFASDSLRGIDRDLVGLAGKATGACMEGMVALQEGDRLLCVDIFEASPSSKCPHANPSNLIETEKNATSPECFASSREKAFPWSFVSLPQAQRLCAGAGKRLPSSDEWYRFALGTLPETCVIDDTEKQLTGTPECIAPSGVHDAIGNVWEWVDESVNGNTFRERALPPEGYVTSVDASGVAITSETNPNALYGEDYMWSKGEGVFGMIRGGFFGSSKDAGLYAVNASVQTSFGSQGVGFRCVEDAL